MTTTPAWRECVATAAVAAVLWLVVGLTGGGDDSDDAGPLIGSAPERIAVTFTGGGYALELDPDHPRVLSPDGTLLGRAWRRETRAIAAALSECRVLRRIELADGGGWGDYGLDDPLELRIGDERWLIGGVGIDRGYARDGDQLLILDLDLAALLRRPAAVLRTPTLDLVGVVALHHGSGWRLERTQDRWWLHLGDQGERLWADQALVKAYLSELTAAPVVGFESVDGTTGPRVSLRFERDGGLAPVELGDLGPADIADGRRLRRAESGIDEQLVVRLDALLLDPEPRRFRSPALLPLDPRRADEVRIGQLVLSRDADGWRVGEHRDVDAGRIDRLLAELAEWPRDDAAPITDRPQIAVRGQGLRFELNRDDPRVRQLADQLRAHHLRDRQVIPGLVASRVSDLIIQPREGAPDIYTRVDGRWPGSEAERAEIAAFLDALLSAQVEEWRPIDQRDEREHYDSTVTLAAGERQYTLRLREDGMVVALGRGLAGRLDGPSRAEVLSQ